MTNTRQLQDFLRLIDANALIDRTYQVYNAVVAAQNVAVDVLTEVGEKLDEVADLVVAFTGTQERSVWEEATDTVDEDPVDRAGSYEYWADFVAENHPHEGVRHGWTRTGEFRRAFYEAIDTGSLADAWVAKLQQRFAEAQQTGVEDDA